MDANTITTHAPISQETAQKLLTALCEARSMMINLREGLAVTKLEFMAAVKVADEAIAQADGGNTNGR